jgi:hypothetical protein
MSQKYEINLIATNSIKILIDKITHNLNYEILDLEEHICKVFI